MEILIGGDVVPTAANIDLFSSGSVNELLGNSLYNLWGNADVRIFNLETPLVDQKAPIAKQGPNLVAPTSTIKGIKELRPELVTLANNHILDQGEYGLFSTQQLLKEYKIPSLGAGDNIAQAAEPYIIKKNGISIGVYACTEHEFTIATNKSAGANPFDPLESLDHIENLKSKCDYVIVLYHGGKEHYRYPSPYLQKVCRKIVEKGADLVVCQHSHCIGCYEEIKGSTIIYGQGNFIFNKYDNEYWNNSLIIKVTISSSNKIEFIPIIRTEKGVSLATGQNAKDIVDEFENRSKEIIKEGFVKTQYNNFSQEKLYLYLRQLSGSGKWISRIDKILFKNYFLKRKYDARRLMAILNYIECEAHRELLISAIKGETNIER